jgi:hypothetical protein
VAWAYRLLLGIDLLAAGLLALLALPALVVWPFLVLVGWFGWAFFHGAVP